MNNSCSWVGFLLIYFIYSCSPGIDKSSPNPEEERIFQIVSEKQSNIDFANIITETEDFNYLFYPYIYEGAGVAVGDINNDNLPDLYFIGNMLRNALYINRGNLKFENITESAGLRGIMPRWNLGATMADVNADGFLDIYISVSGPLPDRRNQLFVNMGNNTFEEKAEEYGIADEGHSMQSVFFDYDKDGDLDLYVANYPPALFRSKNSYYAEKMKNPGPDETDKMYQNNGNGTFSDVTFESGIMNYGLTLGVSVSDFNNDGWLDIYVSNDFNSKDYLYINNGNGSFSDRINEYMMHTAQFGMGTDAADINNDGFMDLVQVDMANRTNQQKKKNMAAMNPRQFHELVNLGLHHQYKRNILQLNTGLNSFSDIAEMARMAYTDWSWGPLVFDMNNDGWKDLFVTTGMRRNVNDNDFLNFVKLLEAQDKIDPAKSLELLEMMPVEPVENYSFLNNGDLSFNNAEGNYGLNFKGFSHGAVYSDLDLDGDLDVVINNMNAKAKIFKNLTSENTNHSYVSFKLRGKGLNKFAVGSKIAIFNKGQSQYQELIPVRGYLSSVEPVVHFGTNQWDKLDSAIITWPDESLQMLYNLRVNQTHLVNQTSKLKTEMPELETREKLFSITELDLDPGFTHSENVFDDFEREISLPHKMSQFGPALAVADVNLDGLDDFFVGGALEIPARLYIQNSSAGFRENQKELWAKERQFEDVSALFFDANGDGYPDLYVVSGGNEKVNGDAIYQDRIYLNDGSGIFYKAEKALPIMNLSGSRVRAADFDKDGDLDLFVGTRQTPGLYPHPSDSQMLRNDSNGSRVSFVKVNDEVAPMLNAIGMVTDAVWGDFTGNGWMDLFLVGEWISLTLLTNEEGIFRDVSSDYGLDRYTGWWNSVTASDLDSDGDLDVIAGNLGLNYKYKASFDEPFEIYSDDFDDNGNTDIVLAYYEENELYPLRGRECSADQIPSIKERFPKFAEFAVANLADVYGERKLKEALHYKATTFASSYIENLGSGFSVRPLDNFTQMSSVNVIAIDDFNGDANPDLFLAGNLFEAEVETPRNDASYGAYLSGDEYGKFTPLLPFQSGVHIKGEIREMAFLRLANGQNGMLLARNEDTLVFVRILKARKN